MALTELQLPNKIEFYGNLQKAATDMKTLISQWDAMADFLENMETTDLDAMTVASGQVRTDLIDFRIVLNEVIAFMDGTSTTQTKIPVNIIDNIRRMVK